MENTASELFWIDHVTIVAYLLVTFIIGIAGNKLMGMKNQKEEDYFLGGRKMPGWLNGVSQAATSLNTDVAPLYCGIALAVGLSSGWFFLSRFGMGLLLAAVLFAVRWRQMLVKTGPEYFQLRFHKGRKFARVYSSVSSVFIGIIPWIGAGLIGLHMVMGPIFGISDIRITLLLVLPLLTVYVWFGGFAGVLLTDAIQGGVILVFNLLLVVSVLWSFGGPTGLAEAVMAANPGESGQAVLSVMPSVSHPVLNPLSIFAWFMLTCVGAGSGVSSDGQRLFSCKNDKEAAKVGIWSEIVLFVMLLMLMLPVMGLIARYPEMQSLSPGKREMAYGKLLSEFLPRGAIGLAVAALLAAAMSTISSHLNYGSQTLLNDVYRPLFGEPAKGREVWIGRLLMLVIVGLSIIVVFCSSSLLGIAITILGLFGAAGSFGWGQWWWYRVNFKGWCAAVLASPLVYFLIGKLLPLWGYWADQVALSEAQAQNMQIIQAVIALLLNTLIWVIVTLVTRPEDMETLKEFYLRARPMGYWEPVRRELIREGRLAETPPRPLILKGIGVAFTGFIMVAAGVLTVSDWYVGKYGEGFLWFSLAGVAGWLFKKWFNRYIACLEIRETKRERGTV